MPPKFAGAVNLHEVQAAEARLHRNSFALAGDSCSWPAACLWVGPARPAQQAIARIVAPTLLLNEKKLLSVPCWGYAYPVIGNDKLKS